MEVILPHPDNSVTLLSKVQKIKWTNRYDCPPGYTFNDEGWIETLAAFPKITVSFLPHLFNKMGEYNLLLQNLLALRLLNNHSHEDLELALRNRYIQARFGRKPDERTFAAAVQASKGIKDSSQLPEFDSDILVMDTIWYSRRCVDHGKSAIKKKIRNNYIASIRSIMPISSKYKTAEVMTEAALSRYAINQYWSTNELDARTRTVSSIVEAVDDLLDNDEELTLNNIASISGVSTRSIQRYKDMWRLTQ